MEKYDKTKKYVRNITIDNLEKKLVTINHVSKMKDGIYHIQQKASLANVSLNDLLTNAAKNILIRYLRKNYYEKTLAKDVKETEILDVNQFISVERSSKTDSEKTGDLMMKLSKEDFIIFMKENFDIDNNQGTILYDKKHNIKQ